MRMENMIQEFRTINVGQYAITTIIYYGIKELQGKLNIFTRRK
jgi:hypothetical protein